MSANYQLRPVTLRDAEELQRACWPDWSIEAVGELLQRVEGITRRSRGLGVVAYSDHGILGYGQITIWPRTTEISDLIVSTPYRGNGVGTAIICHLIEKVRAWHLPKIEIGVAMSNPRALTLYQRLGFKQDRIICLDVGNGLEPVIYLTMDLREVDGLEV